MNSNNRIANVGVIVEIDPSSILLLAVAMTLPVLVYSLFKFKM